MADAIVSDIYIDTSKKQQTEQNNNINNNNVTTTTQSTTDYSISSTTTSDTTTDLTVSTDSFTINGGSISNPSSPASAFTLHFESTSSQGGGQNSSSTPRVNSGIKTYPLHESAYKGEYDRLVSLILFIQGKVNSLKSPSNSPQGPSLRGHHYPHISHSTISTYYKNNPHPQPTEQNLHEFTGVNSLDDKFTTALHHAAFNGHKQCVKLLLASHAYPDVKDVDGCTPLHNAAFNGYRSVIQLLIECGADVNSQDIDQNTALHKCTFSGHHKCAELLLDNGCDIEARDSHGITPLLKSAVNKHFKCLVLLLDKGADVNSKDNSNTTALHQACYKGSDRCVSLLISRGADVNCYDKEGYSPLHNAVYNGFEECSRILLDKGANIDQRALDGCSPLHYAASNGSEQCLSLLIRRGCKLDITDVKRGRTALHYAASKGHLGCVELLLKAGADSNIKDFSHKSPKNLTQNQEIISLLSAYQDLEHKSKRRPSKSSSKHKHSPSNTSTTSTPPTTPSPVPHNKERSSSISTSVQQTTVLTNNNTTAVTTTTTIAVPIQTTNTVPVPKDSLSGSITTTTTTSNNNITNNNNLTLSTSPNSITQNQVTTVSSPNINSSNHQSDETISRSNSNDSISTTITVATNNSNNNNSKENSTDMGSPEIKPKLDIYGFVKTSNGGGGIEEVRTKKLEKREKFWLKLIKEGSSLKKSSLANKVRDKLPKGIPSSVRGCVWQRLVNTTEIKNKAKITYKELLEKQPLPSIHIQIQKDLNRTFPKHSLFIEKGGMGQQILCNILTAFSIYNPEVGYCQGMGFITCLLMIYMAEEDAFWGLVQITEKYGMSEMWKTDFPYLQTSFTIFEQLLAEIFPSISSHLKKQNVFTPLYSTQWFICLLIYNLPFPIIIRVWDMFLYDGLIIIFAAALALFKMNEEQILKFEFEEIVALLKFASEDKDAGSKIDINTFIKHIVHYRNKIKHTIKDPNLIKDPNDSISPTTNGTTNSHK
ncbi:ankyrin repeat-containing protein [Tieghemostelium lacteum]|uniref:Ankyrin repeat-containing protein n=1 Tax=Tieghemostelium lacteum TaxID=361077 RepID=A0A151ZBP7_TIELA|nr:ankyrin repeat-containing protein [Tieghemostelium lacteum]|eukprot:KYQ91372.1 ankyrin repeat-containing protein [Tieghemostelium lacteum]